MRLDCFFLLGNAISTRELWSLHSLLSPVCSFQRIAGTVPETIFNKFFCGQVRNKHFGGITAVVRPVPIPNTAVKHCRADGSSPIGSARVGRRQFFIKEPEKISSPAFCFPANSFSIRRLILKSPMSRFGSLQVV